MTRSKMILVIVCALGLGSYCLWKSNDDYLNPKGPLVYALRNIEKGSVVTSNSIETRIVEVRKMPASSVTNASTVIGRKPVYSIENGQILSRYDFMLPEEAKQYRLDLIGPLEGLPDSESKTPTK